MLFFIIIKLNQKNLFLMDVYLMWLLLPTNNLPPNANFFLFERGFMISIFPLGVQMEWV